MEIITEILGNLPNFLLIFSLHAKRLNPVQLRLISSPMNNINVWTADEFCWLQSCGRKLVVIPMWPAHGVSAKYILSKKIMNLIMKLACVHLMSSAEQNCLLFVLGGFPRIYSHNPVGFCTCCCWGSNLCLTNAAVLWSGKCPAENATAVSIAATQQRNLSLCPKAFRTLLEPLSKQLFQDCRVDGFIIFLVVSFALH